jgi:uncharacterized protein (TIGR00730 family)
MLDNSPMENTNPLSASQFASEWHEFKPDAKSRPDTDSAKLAFADPEFLLRPETREIRFQLEMLKPELELALQGIENTVVVFGSARFVSPETAAERLAQAQESTDAEALERAQRGMRNSAWYEQSRQFARLVAGYSAGRAQSDQLYICTGGGPGVMEAANRGAFEMGAPSVGLNITLPHEQAVNRYVTPSLRFQFHYFAARKMHFMLRAKALVAFPGGYGTLDELFEIITLVQTKKAKPVPIVLYGSAYWKRLINFEVMLEEGAIGRKDLDLFHYCDTPQDAWNVIKAFYELGDADSVGA